MTDFYGVVSFRIKDSATEDENHQAFREQEPIINTLDTMCQLFSDAIVYFCQHEQHKTNHGQHRNKQGRLCLIKFDLQMLRYKLYITYVWHKYILWSLYFSLTIWEIKKTILNPAIMFFQDLNPLPTFSNKQSVVFNALWIIK